MQIYIYYHRRWVHNEWSRWKSKEEEKKKKRNLAQLHEYSSMWLFVCTYIHTHVYIYESTLLTPTAFDGTLNPINTPADVQNMYACTYMCSATCWGWRKCVLVKLKSVNTYICMYSHNIMSNSCFAPLKPPAIRMCHDCILMRKLTKSMDTNMHVRQPNGIEIAHICKSIISFFFLFSFLKRY